MSGEEGRKSTANTKESVTTCSYLQYIADSGILCNAASMSEAVTITDAIDPARAQALLASLGRPQRVKSGDVLPPLAHFAYFWEPVDEAQTGRDGHARPGGLIPDLGLPTRMWAGGRLTFHAPFRAGFAAQKVTTLHEVKERQGRSGRLGLVTLKHEIRQRHAPVISEMQDIVYREPGPLTGDPPVETGKAHVRHALKLQELTLFRYSAITFNGHRIHYDANYCREEGYPGLVVHGPFLATRLACLAAEHLGTLKSFSCRATAPLFLGDAAWLCRAGDKYWVEGPNSRRCMVATAT